MYVDESKCIGCGDCVLYCPVSAIKLDDHANIDYEECVECSNCIRFDICPTDAIYRDDLTWPRIVRNVMSDHQAKHSKIGLETELGGRGTEEMKTNDVTNRIKDGYVGLAIEFGRPILGAKFSDIKKISEPLGAFGVEFEEQNPITLLMDDKNKGTYPKELLNEKILTGILEFILKEEQLTRCLEIIVNYSKTIKTVFSLCLLVKCDEDGEISESIVEKLKELNIRYYLSGKTCVGLGRNQ